MFHRFVSVTQLRAWLGAACLALLVAACGGGGGSPGTPGGGSGNGTGTVAPALPALLGIWQLTITNAGVTTAPVAVEAAAVPTSANAFDNTGIARLLARSRFQNYTTGINGSTLRVTDADTDYTMVINSFTVSQFQGCGTCEVGTAITFTLNVNFNESGTFDGVLLPSRTTSIELQVRYVRAS